jgi:hypothetical protein
MDQDGTVWIARNSINGVYGVPPPYDGSNQLPLAPPYLGGPTAIAVYP